MRESLNIEKVMQTAVKELHEALGSVETKVWLDVSEPDSEE